MNTDSAQTLLNLAAKIEANTELKAFTEQLMRDDADARAFLTVISRTPAIRPNGPHLAQISDAQTGIVSWEGRDTDQDDLEQTLIAWVPMPGKT